MFSFLTFNAIVRVCLKQLLPTIYRFLRIKLVTTIFVLFKELIHIWATSLDERSRVIAFVCLFHLIRKHRKEMIAVVLRVVLTHSS
ncbi:unnamed protein product [Rotaria sordida]|uniref:Uncharacterized protein n=1 Tax=Rotaria sordida TaxID=392033 RepID=A0A819L101_9BILA|nr:unnamed protein product [Rotaria sordida]